MILYCVFIFILMRSLFNSRLIFICKRLCLLKTFFYIIRFIRLLYYLRSLSFYWAWINKWTYCFTLNKNFLIVFWIIFIYGLWKIFNIFFAKWTDWSDWYIFILTVIIFFFFDSLIFQIVPKFMIIFIWKIELISLITCHVFA